MPLNRLVPRTKMLAVFRLDSDFTLYLGGFRLVLGRSLACSTLYWGGFQFVMGWIPPWIGADSCFVLGRIFVARSALGLIWMFRAMCRPGSARAPPWVCDVGCAFGGVRGGVRLSDFACVPPWVGVEFFVRVCIRIRCIMEHNHRNAWIH